MSLNIILKNNKHLRQKNLERQTRSCFTLYEDVKIIKIGSKTNIKTEKALWRLETTSRLL